MALLDALDAARREFHVSLPYVTVGAVSGVVIVLCVLFHYEVMSWSARLVPRLGLRRRARIVAVMLALLAAHVVEVWIFAMTYWALELWPSLGHVDGGGEGVLDLVYFSVSTYTTLGFGDMVPKGAVRVLCGSEGLAGLALITWSASQAFLEMQSNWREYRPTA